MSIALVTSPVGGLSSARGVAVTSELEESLPGHHQLITILDTTSQKAAFWQSSILVVP